MRSLATETRRDKNRYIRTRTRMPSSMLPFPIIVPRLSCRKLNCSSGGLRNQNATSHSQEIQNQHPMTFLTGYISGVVGGYFVSRRPERIIAAAQMRKCGCSDSGNPIRSLIMYVRTRYLFLQWVLELFVTTPTYIARNNERSASESQCGTRCRKPVHQFEGKEESNACGRRHTHPARIAMI